MRSLLSSLSRLSLFLSWTYTYPCTTRLEPAYIHSATACTLACPGVRSLFLLPLIIVLAFFPCTYVPAMDGRPPFPFPPLIPHRPHIDFSLYPQVQSPTIIQSYGNACSVVTLKPLRVPVCETQSPPPLRLNDVVTSSH